MEQQVANIGLNLSYALLGLATLGVLFSAIKALAMNPKGAIKAVIFLAGFGVIYAIGNGMASNEVTAKYSSLGIDADLSQMVGAFVNVMWIFLVLGFLAILFAQVKSFFK